MLIAPSGLRKSRRSAPIGAPGSTLITASASVGLKTVVLSTTTPADREITTPPGAKFVPAMRTVCDRLGATTEPGATAVMAGRTAISPRAICRLTPLTPVIVTGMIPLLCGDTVTVNARVADGVTVNCDGEIVTPFPEAIVTTTSAAGGNCPCAPIPKVGVLTGLIVTVSWRVSPPLSEIKGGDA